MRMRSNWLAASAVGAAMVLVLAACGGEDPTATPAPTATPTPADAMMEKPTATPVDAMTPKPTATATPVPQRDPGVTFEGRTIRIVANSSPGGGTDAQGRVMAAFMSRYIPGNPRVVFTNNPNKPLEYIYAATRAPKDGTYVSWNSTPQLDFGFSDETQFIKRSTFQAIGSTIDPTRGWMLYDPVGNLGPSAAESCLWDYSGQSSTGGGAHGEFLLADELGDIAEGNATLLATVYASEQLDVPFRYFRVRHGGHERGAADVGARRHQQHGPFQPVVPVPGRESGLDTGRPDAADGGHGARSVAGERTDGAALRGRSGPLGR